MMKSKMMRLSAVCSALAILLSFSVPGSLSAKSPHTIGHEIIVSKDGDGDYKSFHQAFMSITDASATNRYLITLKPGVYSCGIGSEGRNLNFIDIRGSGVNNTTCNFPPLGCVTDSVISDITLDGFPGYIESYDGEEHEVILKRVKKINGNAIWISGDPAPTVKIIDSTIISSDYGGGYDEGVHLERGNLIVEDSFIDGHDAGIAVSSEHWHGGTSVTIRNSQIVSSNSAIKMKQMSNCSSRVIVYNSVLSGTDVLLFDPSAGMGDELFTAAGSQLIGNINTRPGIDKLVNCYDEGFNPIANH